MKSFLTHRPSIASVARAMAVLLAAACTELPTGTRDITNRPPTAPLLTQFSQNGALYFDPASDCAFNTGTGNIDCNLTLKGLSAGTMFWLSNSATWDVSVYCVNAKTGKRAPNKLQPATPIHTTSGSGVGWPAFDANNEYVWNDFVIFPPGLSSSFYCPQRPYDTAVFGVPQATSWALHAFKLDDEFGTFADMWDTIP